MVSVPLLTTTVLQARALIMWTERVLGLGAVMVRTAVRVPVLLRVLKRKPLVRHRHRSGAVLFQVAVQLPPIKLPR